MIRALWSLVDGPALAITLAGFGSVAFLGFVAGLLAGWRLRGRAYSPRITHKVGP